MIVVPFTDPEALKRLEDLIDPPGDEIVTFGKKQMRVAKAKTVGRIRGLKISIYADEHPPPHFSVSMQGESANYRISDGKRLTPGLERYDREIQQWQTEHKQMLIHEWDSTRPTDCPVGKYREPDAGGAR